jgi:hypothetical protein
MTNPYYEHVPISPVGWIRSPDLSSLSARIAAGFDLIPTPTELRRGLINWQATDTGVADAYAVALTHVAAYASGLTFGFIPANTNTGASTVNINALGAKSVSRLGGGALVAGDLPAGVIAILTYDGAKFQITGGGGPDAAMMSVASVMEAEAGEANNVVITPSRAFAAIQAFFDENRIQYGDLTFEGTVQFDGAAVFQGAVTAEAGVAVTAGAFTLANDQSLFGLNGVSAAVNLAKVNGSDEIEFGESGVNAVLYGSAVTVYAGTSFSVAVGGDTAMEIDADEVALFLPLVLATHTVANAPAASDSPSGLIYVSNGDAGYPCLGFASGGSWLRIPLTATRYANLGLAISAS